MPVDANAAALQVVQNSVPQHLHGDIMVNDLSPVPILF